MNELRGNDYLRLTTFSNGFHDSNLQQSLFFAENRVISSGEIFIFNPLDI